jgi:hypothetical protein
VGRTEKVKPCLYQSDAFGRGTRHFYFSWFSRFLDHSVHSHGTESHYLAFSLSDHPETREMFGLAIKIMRSKLHGLMKGKSVERLCVDHVLENAKKGDPQSVCWRRNFETPTSEGPYSATGSKRNRQILSFGELANECWR